MVFAILAHRAKSNTIREGGFETIEISPHDIYAPVQYHPGKMLSHALAHNSRLTMMNIEAFLEQNGCNVRGKSLDIPFETVVAGKCEVISIARISCPSRPGQSR
jgi:hypothetical protein